MLKRVVISLVALFTLFACYSVYKFTFGQLAQLKPLLPGQDPPTPSNDTPWDQPTPTSNYAKDLSSPVWGDDSWQAGDDVIVLYWLHSGVVVYIKDYEKETPETWRLTPFSLVYSEPSKTPGGQPQLVTLDGREATLVFDGPVDLIRMSGARPIGGTISGNVQITADRGTNTPVDDLIAYADELQFLEAEKRALDHLTDPNGLGRCGNDGHGRRDASQIRRTDACQSRFARVRRG